jgi:DHA1 family multidrug resistance protein-like MFS transporter
VSLLRLDEYRVLSREVLFLVLVNSIFGFAIGFGAPSVAPLIVFVNVSMTFVGNVRAFSQAVATLIRPLLGPLIDRHGAKPFYLLGGVVTTVGYLSYALTESWLLLAAGLMLTSSDVFLRSFASTTAIGSWSEPETRGKAFSLDMGAGQVASMIAPLMGGYVADQLQLSFRWIFGTVVGLMIVGLALMATRHSPSKRPEGVEAVSFKAYLRQAFSIDRRLRSFAMILVLDWTVWGLSFPFYQLFIYKQLGATTEQLGIVVAISSASPAIVGFLLGPMLDRWKPKWFLAVSELVAIGSITPILVGTRPEVAYLSAVFWGLNYGLWVPAMHSLILDTVGSKSFGRASGSVNVLASLLSIPSPAIAGWLYDNVSPKVPFIVTLIGAIAIGVLMLALLKEPKGIQPSDTLTSVRQEGM